MVDLEDELFPGMFEFYNTNEYFSESLEEVTYYTPETYFTESCYNFASRFSSLERYWLLVKKNIQLHLDNINETSKSDSAEIEDQKYDLTATDSEYFSEYINLSVLSFALALIEDLLISISEEIRREVEVIPELPKKEMPYINKYLNWLVKGMGFDLSIDKKTNRALNTIREVRNKFIHQMSRDLPEQIQKSIKELIENQSPKGQLSIAFIEKSLHTIAVLAKKIEIAYLKYLGYEVQ